LIFVPPVREGRRVIVVFMGPTGTRTLPTMSSPSQAPRRTTAARPRARSQAGCCGWAGKARGDCCVRCGRVRARGALRMWFRAFKAAGTRAIGPVCPSPGVDMRAVSCLSCGWVVADNGLVLEMTREEFEELVAEALDRIPPELTRLMDNVAVFVEDEPPADDPELLGLYEGTPLTERGEWYAGVLPDRITIYRGPTLRMCGSREEVVAETEVTVVHEIAHHFGIDDTRLHALGYG
jgi:predicted Zn-dependent protease with MMP-like domain